VDPNSNHKPNPRPFWDQTKGVSTNVPTDNKFEIYQQISYMDNVKGVNHGSQIILQIHRSTSTLVDPNPKPNVNRNPRPFCCHIRIIHGNEMKGYGSCALIITISDFRGPPK
jgi:hypothetical protein